MIVNVRELCTVLEELYGILNAANAKNQSKDVAAFLKLFKGAEDQTVEQFLQDLEARLKEKTEPPTPSTRQPNRQIVERHVRALLSAGTDKVSFDAAIADLSGDKSAEREEAEAIAFDYIGYPGGRKSWPTRKAALQAIGDWFRQLAYDAVKSKQLDKARYIG